MTETTRLYAFADRELSDPHAVQLELDATDWTRLDAERARERREQTFAPDDIGNFLMVTDRATGERWWVATGPCGAPCRCATVAMRVDALDDASANPRTRTRQAPSA